MTWFIVPGAAGTPDLAAELPVERPDRFELLLNLRAVRALGLTLPPSILQQATEIVE